MTMVTVLLSLYDTGAGLVKDELVVLFKSALKHVQTLQYDKLLSRMASTL